MTIRVDSTTISTVVTCTDCYWFNAFRFTRSEGWDVAGRHERDYHPEHDSARRRGRRYHEHLDAMDMSRT